MSGVRVGSGTSYIFYHLRNAQGDIVKLIDSSGNTVVEYTHQAGLLPLDGRQLGASSLPQRAAWQIRLAQISPSVTGAMSTTRKRADTICSPAATIPTPAGSYPRTFCSPQGRGLSDITPSLIVGIIRLSELTRKVSAVILLTLVEN